MAENCPTAFRKAETHVEGSHGPKILSAFSTSSIRWRELRFGFGLILTSIRGRVSDRWSRYAAATFSKNVADGTKNSVPVTARL